MIQMIDFIKEQCNENRLYYIKCYALNDLVMIYVVVNNEYSSTIHKVLIDSDMYDVEDRSFLIAIYDSHFVDEITICTRSDDYHELEIRMHY